MLTSVSTARTRTAGEGTWQRRAPVCQWGGGFHQLTSKNEVDDRGPLDGAWDWDLLPEVCRAAMFDGH